ncbi:TMEM175 family protein [Deinococcus radiomollis]|uniref:TMEM175 family protein n=1 Tax=Deinococcus radiomollis TaxID=468916 RepID=UPI003891E597
MTKSRLEAFSDGVLAIIITIMVLELRTPQGHGWSELIRLWPTLLAYVLSFIYVGIYWNNHHHLMLTVRRINGATLWANLHLLFWLSLFPFVSGWVGESRFAAVTMTCYAAVALMAAVAYTILAAVIVRADTSNHLLADALGSDTKGKLSLVAYVVAIVSPFAGQIGTVLSGLMMIAVALMWLIPDRRIEAVLEREKRS